MTLTISSLEVPLNRDFLSCEAVAIIKLIQILKKQEFLLFHDRKLILIFKIQLEGI